MIIPKMSILIYIAFALSVLGCSRDITSNVIGAPELKTYTADELDMTQRKKVIYVEAYTNSGGGVYTTPSAHVDDRQLRQGSREVRILSVSDWEVVYVSALTDAIYEAPPANDEIYHIAIGDSSWGPRIYIYQRPNESDTAIFKNLSSTFRPIVELQGTQAALNVLLWMYIEQNELPDYYFSGVGGPNVSGDIDIITDEYLSIYLFTTQIPGFADPAPQEGSQLIMDKVNRRRTNAYNDAKATDDFTTLPDVSDEIFKEVILAFGFEEKGFAMKLITIWEETFFARHQAGVIDDAAIEKYNNFLSIYHEKLEVERGEPYFEYIRAYDNIITEYLRLALELEGLVSEEERIERFRESMMQGKADIIYPEDF